MAVMCLRISPDVVWTDSDNEVRLYDAASGRFRTLNATAAAVWRRVAGGERLDEMIDALAREYGAADDRQRSRVDTDVRQFVDDLVDGRLVEAVPC